MLTHSSVHFMHRLNLGIQPHNTNLRIKTRFWKKKEGSVNKSLYLKEQEIKNSRFTNPPFVFRSLEKPYEIKKWMA